MKNVLFAVALGVLVSACSSSGSGEASGQTGPMTTAANTGASTAATTTAASTPQPGGGGIAGPATEAGAKTVVAALQAAADPMVEFKKLKPGPDELKALFSDAATADAVGKQIDEMFAKGDKVEFPKGDANVFCASSEDVKAWKPDVEKNFPGGYKRVGPKLNSGFTLCKFKTGGIAYDALVNIKGNWFLVIKPFRAIKE